MKMIKRSILLILLVMVLLVPSYSVQAKSGMYNLGYPVHINGTKVEFQDALINENKTYIALRDFCSKAGLDVEWVDPNYHQLPIPGGNLPSGISINIPSYVYVKEVTNFKKTDEKIKVVDITGIYNKFKEGKNYTYYFSDYGLVIKDKNGEKLVKLNYNPSNEYMYVSVDEFREKLQPHFVDICMQE